MTMETEDKVILTSADLDLCYTLPFTEGNKENMEDNAMQGREDSEDFEIEFKKSE